VRGQTGRQEGKKYREQYRAAGSSTLEYHKVLKCALLNQRGLETSTRSYLEQKEIFRSLYLSTKTYSDKSLVLLIYTVFFPVTACFYSVARNFLLSRLQLTAFSQLLPM